MPRLSEYIQKDTGACATLIQHAGEHAAAIRPLAAPDSNDSKASAAAEEAARLRQLHSRRCVYPLSNLASLCFAGSSVNLFSRLNTQIAVCTATCPSCQRHTYRSVSHPLKAPLHQPHRLRDHGSRQYRQPDGSLAPHPPPPHPFTVVSLNSNC